MSNYLVGIDLGTTNTVVYYIDKTQEEAVPELFKVLQVTESGEIDEREELPSFVYIPDEKELPEGAIDLPWKSGNDCSVGTFARKNAPQLPGKVIASTKSWLCAENVDRLAPILPWNRNNPEKQMSPLQASQQILEHIKNAWDHVIAEGDSEKELANQSVVLTVPASFDAVARELTVKAAEEAGINVVLLEEPLAAFYAWLYDTGEQWREQIQPDDVVLVCDIGGGTTDFTLIKAVDKDGTLEFERLAVGKHILLGGDNMDLTTAYTVANKLKTEKNTTLDNYQIAGLTHACRDAKEVLLSSIDAPPQKLTVLGRGSSLIGGTITTEISREDLVDVMLDGFFPACEFDAKPAEAARAGLRSFGLSYEANPAITLHLAHFLHSQTNGGSENMPNCIFFNGGVTKAGAVRKRIVDTVSSWLPEGSDKVKVISGNDPDKSVAKGGARYGHVREGEGIRIKAGSSHSYYIGVESSMPAIPGFTPPVSALCVIPAGMEEGTGEDIPYSGLGLLVGQASQFRFFSTTVRNEQLAGQVIEDVEGCEDIDELPMLATNLEASNEIPAGSLIPITLRSELTETGTLQVWCISEDGANKWKLEFELRSDDLLTRNKE